MTTPLILDTDIGGDADDAMALALCLRHPDIDLRAVTTVSGNAEDRARIAAKLLQLAGRNDVPVHAGISDDPDRENAGDVILGDGEVPAISPGDAVTALVDAVGSAPAALTIATIGSQSNVAAALDVDPAFSAGVGRLAVMGGVFAPMHVGGRHIDADADYNLNVDPAASVRALNAGMPTLYVPCDVTFGTALRTKHLDRLRAGDDLCRAVARMIEVWTPVMRRYTPGLPDDVVSMMHDPLTVAAVVDGSFVTVEPLPVTVAMHDGHVRTFVDPVEGQLAEVVRSVDAAAFADWWLDVVLR